MQFALIIIFIFYLFSMRFKYDLSKSEQAATNSEELRVNLLFLLLGDEFVLLRGLYLSIESEHARIECLDATVDRPDHACTLHARLSSRNTRLQIQ